jgi:hypothetical protein
MPDFEKYPASHSLQTLDEFAPISVDAVPAGQLVHSLAPVTFEYVPSIQKPH